MNIAKWIVAFVGVLGIGGFLADYVIWETARQHMKNPAWPPHAKFHNAQTILMGIGLGVITLTLLFRFDKLQLSGLLEASCTASLYWVSLLLAPIFPATAWNDPEFRNSTPVRFGIHPQQLLAIGVMILIIVALLFGTLSS
jgi:hypothetical protein